MQVLLIKINQMSIAVKTIGQGTVTMPKDGFSTLWTAFYSAIKFKSKINQTINQYVTETNFAYLVTSKKSQTFEQIYWVQIQVISGPVKQPELQTVPPKVPCNEPVGMKEPTAGWYDRMIWLNRQGDIGAFENLPLDLFQTSLITLLR